MAHRRKGAVKCVVRTHSSRSNSGSQTTPGMGTLTTHTYYKRCRGLRPELKGDELKGLTVFAKACELAGLPTTCRQLSKWNLKKGLARTLGREAKVELNSND